MFLSGHITLVTLMANIIGYGGLWYFYGFKIAMFVWFAMFANNLEQRKK